MTDKHTPEPWKVEKNLLGIREDRSEFFTYSVIKILNNAAETPITIAECISEANARLIALAPEYKAFINRVANEPIGTPESSAREILNILTVEATILLSRINSKRMEGI